MGLNDFVPVEVGRSLEPGPREARAAARCAAIRSEPNSSGRAESFSCNYTYREANRGSLYRQLGHFGFSFNGPLDLFDYARGPSSLSFFTIVRRFAPAAPLALFHRVLRHSVTLSIIHHGHASFPRKDLLLRMETDAF